MTHFVSGTEPNISPAGKTSMLERFGQSSPVTHLPFVCGTDYSAVKSIVGGGEERDRIAEYSNLVRGLSVAALANKSLDDYKNLWVYRSLLHPPFLRVQGDSDNPWHWVTHGARQPISCGVLRGKLPSAKTQ